TAAARDGAEPGFGELSDDFLERQFEDVPEMNELARAEAVDVDLREFALDMRKQIQIPLDRELGMMAPLHQNLGAAQSDGLLNFLIHLRVADDVGIVVTFDTVKGAEFAINIANVGVIDIPVNDVGDDIIAAPLISVGFGKLTPAVRKCAKFFQRQTVETQRFRRIDPMAIPNFLQQL